jgi:hypothetical protein
VNADELERALYELDDVVSARVLVRPERVEVDILTKPSADAEGVVAAALEAARAMLPASDRPVEIRALALGSTDVAAVIAEDATPSIEPPGPAERGRVQLVSVVAIDDTTNVTAEVSLQRGGAGHGRSTSSRSAKTIPLLVAEATLLALGEVCTTASDGAVCATDVVRVGAQEIVIAVVSFPDEPDGEVLAGTAPIRHHGPLDATARAVLCAVNRRVAHADAEDGAR